MGTDTMNMRRSASRAQRTDDTSSAGNEHHRHEITDSEENTSDTLERKQANSNESSSPTYMSPWSVCRHPARPASKNSRPSGRARASTSPSNRRLSPHSTSKSAERHLHVGIVSDHSSLERLDTYMTPLEYGQPKFTEIYDGFPSCLRTRMECDDKLVRGMGKSLPDYSLAPVAAYFFTYDPDVLIAAYGHFLRAVGVNPAGHARSIEEIDAIHDAFIAWFAFDYKCADERTPLERYLDDNSVGMHRLPREKIAALWSVLNCSVEGAFEVAAAWPSISVTILRGLHDNEEYAICDEAMTRSLQGCVGSIICTRITQFGSQWTVTARPFHVIGRDGTDMTPIEVKDTDVFEAVRQNNRESEKTQKNENGGRRKRVEAHRADVPCDRTTLAALSFLMLIRIVFAELSDTPYDQKGHEERDYAVLGLVLSELGME